MKKSKKKQTKKNLSKKATASKAKPKLLKKTSSAKKVTRQITPVTTINPYLTFNGNCEEAFNFYKSVFGGNFNRLSRFRDIPPMEGQEMSEDLKERIMHVSLPISKETFLMGSDSNPMMGEVTVGQHLSLSVNTGSKNEANRIFKLLSAGGQITMPIADMFWGSYFGMLSDKFGIVWMVNSDQSSKSQ